MQYLGKTSLSWYRLTSRITFEFFPNQKAFVSLVIEDQRLKRDLSRAASELCHSFFCTEPSCLGLGCRVSGPHPVTDVHGSCIMGRNTAMTLGTFAFGAVSKDEYTLDHLIHPNSW